MAKNDDEDKKVQKKYAAETRGMPANLARIAARNLAAEDARISRLNEIRGRIEADRPENAAAIARRYQGEVFSGDKGVIPPGAAPGVYATGVVGTPYIPPREAAFNRAAAYRAGYGEPAPYTAGGYRFAGGVADPVPTFGEEVGGGVAAFLPTLGRFAARGGFALPGLAGMGLSGAQSFFPAIRSFFNRGRPRPYNPAPVLRNVAAPAPSPTPAPSPSETPNPYYADTAF